ncbi:YdcH family protein [Candidatus Vondammii sp. HM_W22]|uniref:YdcH family protein n=1 Tax=Candidatus Vondammii sp. HM_W22 TaxID=2687299 RepID=UPI001F137051|nr:YdcH family protein [Candidatus Vondammii sp. HM_W22]
MLGKMHDILHEFPTLEDKIHDLEEHDQPTSDVRMEDLKKKRALLKDQIYGILRPLA